MSQIQQTLLAVLFLSSGTLSWAGDSVVTIRIYSEVALSERVLAKAEQEGTRIFHEARMETTWVYCETSSTPTDSRCHEMPGPTQLVLRIVPKALSAADSIFGMAFLSENGGVYSDVFFDSVETLHRDHGAPLARVLGHVMAHEVGHLLLGSHSHSARGIMRASWHGEQLRMIAMGGLFFTSQQARAMKARILGM